MTNRPYLYISLSIANGDPEDYTGDVDLGQVENEAMDGSRTLINLADTGGNTKDVQLAALLSGERSITLSGVKKFSSYTDKDTFCQRLDALWQGTKLTSSRYYPFTLYNVYSGQAYFDVMVTHFGVSSTEVEEYFSGGQGAVVVHFTLDMKEGKGVGGTI
jgi:hypothetical protein